MIVHLDYLIGIPPVGAVKFPFRLELDWKLEVAEVILAVECNDLLELLLGERLVGCLPERPYAFLRGLDVIHIDKVACGIGIHAGIRVPFQAAEFIEEKLPYGILAGHRRLIFTTFTRIVCTFARFVIPFARLLVTFTRLVVPIVHGNLVLVRAGIQGGHCRRQAQNHE